MKYYEQVQIKKKEKINKSREEILYQIKVFFLLISVVRSVFVNQPGARNQLSMFCASSIRETHRNSKELHNTHKYQKVISRHCPNQSGIIVLVNWPRAHCGVLHLTEASSLGTDPPRTSPRKRLWSSVDVKWRILQSSGHHQHPWHSCRITLKQRWFAFIRPRTPLVYRYHVISWIRVFGCSPSGWMREQHPPRAVNCLTDKQFLNWSDWIWTGQAAQIEAKTKFRFGNIVPKQWILSEFVQHTSANSMYKDDNKISQQQKVLHMNKMLKRVTHFQKTLSVGIQPLS